MLSSLKYKLDLSGTLPENRVESRVVIGATTNRAFALPAGPYFTDDFLIVDVNNPQTPLVRGQDFEHVYLYSTLTKQAKGKEITGVVVIKNPNVGTDLTVTANHVGGPYVNQYNLIVKAIEDLQLDNREYDFSRLEGIPENWEAAPHLQDLGDIFGFEFHTSILSEMVSVISAGKTPEVQSMLDGLANIESRLQDAITAHRAAQGNVHNTSAHQTGTYNSGEIDTFFNTLRNEIAVVASSLGDVNDTIGILSDRVDAVVALFKEHTKILAALSDDFNTLDGFFGNINKDVADMKAKDKSQDAALAAIRTELERLQAEQQTIRDSIKETDDDVMTKAGGTMEGPCTAEAFGVSNPDTRNARGINLFGEADDTAPPNYGIFVGATITYGTHGFVTGDIATYFAMAGATNRGWIWRHGGKNVASLSAAGDLRLNGRVLSDEDVRGYSDERLKTEMTVIPDALEKIIQLNGYTYRRKDIPGHPRGTGVSAQEVQKVLPEAVEKEGEYLTVAYGNMVGLLIEGVKGNQSRIDRLERLLNAMDSTESEEA